MMTRLALGLLAIGWLTLLVGLAFDARRDGPEDLLRTYLSDLGAQRSRDALEALTPAAAIRWGDFVDFQQHNRYQIVSIATRYPSLVEVALRQVPWRATQATLVVEVAEPSGTVWRGSTVVPVTWHDGRWWIERPPFASD
jgi:hypothetical protein